MSGYFKQGDTLNGGPAGTGINILIPSSGALLGASNVGGTITPQTITLGSGLSLAGTVLSATGSGGSVTQVATTGAGISGGPITGSGTLSVEWNGGTVSAIGNGLTINVGNTLSIEAGAGLSFSTGSLVAGWQATTVTGLATGLSVATGNLTPQWQGGAVSALAASLGLSGGTLSALWNAGTVSALGGSMAINSGTITNQHQGTITLSGTTTGTISPANVDSALVNIGTAAGTIAISPGFTGQRLRVEIKQGATAQTVTFTNTVVYGTTIPSYTATASANARDALQMICFDGTHWGVAGIAQGFTI